MYQAAILGLGRIASSLEDDPLREKPCTHAGVIKRHPQTRLVAGVDLMEEKRSTFSLRWKCSNTYPSLSSMMKNQKIDILHIATPSYLHLKHLSEALDYKIPLIILEKPITDTMNNYSKCQLLAKRIKKSTSRVVVNHERRFAEDYRYLKENLEKATWGKLDSVSAYFYTNTKTPPNKILFHDGTHLIDILFFLLGDNLSLVSPLKTHSAYLKQFSFTLNKTPAFLELSSDKKHFHFELIFNFSQARVSIGNGIFKIEEARPSELYQGIKSLKIVKEKPFKKTRYFINMHKHAVGLLEKPQNKNFSSFEDGLAILKFFKKISIKNSR